MFFRGLYLTLLAAVGAAGIYAQVQLPPPQFNVPYRCADGTAYIVHRCETGPKGQVCFYRIEKNGQLQTEAFNIRSQMTGWMNACPVQTASPAKPTAAPAQRPNVAWNSPNLNPAYLRDMPSVESVEHTIQGSNPNDTLARQLAMFVMLKKVVMRLPGPTRPYMTFTTDEQQMMGAYDLANYELSQAYAKSHTPEEVKALTQLAGRYDMSDAFNREMFEKLLSPAIRAEYAKMDASWAARQRARVEANRKETEKMEAQAAAAPGNSPFVRNDPGTLAARRCVELGGSDLECVGKGFMTGFSDLTGMDKMVGKKQVRTGLVMTGRYAGAGELNFSFGDEAVAINGCGKLVPNSHAYALVKNGNRFTITLQAEPKPFVVTLGPDGQLTGPSVTDIKGEVITGYRNVWMQEYRNGIAVAGGGYWAQEPVFAPKTERCTIGGLRPAGPTGTAGSAVNAILNTISGQSQSLEQGARDAQKDLPAPGVRVSGQYSGQGGLALEFTAERVVLDCGEAHVAKPYTVENASQVLVHVNNGAAPFTLAVQPDGTLTGSGSVDVAGRVVTGSTDNGIAFAPRNARCAVGVLMPNRGGAAQATGSVAPSSAASPAGGNGVLSVTAGFPIQLPSPSPMNGLTLYLLKESFASIAAKSGIRPGVGMTVIQGWGEACDKQAPECAQAIKAAVQDVMNKVKLDMEGKASFAAMPAGTYHLFGWVLYNGHHLVWDLNVDLKVGANGISIDQGNAVVLN